MKKAKKIRKTKQSELAKWATSNFRINPDLKVVDRSNDPVFKATMEKAERMLANSNIGEILSR